MVSQLNKFSIDGIISTIYQSLIPAPLSDFMYQKISNIVNRICEAFKLDNSPLLIQAIVQGEEINIIELTARIGGGAKYVTIPQVTGFDILDANIDSMLGIKPVVQTERNKYFYSRCQLYTHSGIFDRVEGIEELIGEGKIKSVSYNGKVKGDQLYPAQGNTNRFASVFIKADSYSILKARVSEVINRIKIIDISGNDILNRDMYE